MRLVKNVRVRLLALLIKISGRHKVVKRLLKRFLRVVEERLPAVPARAAQSARTIIQTVKLHRKILVLCILKRHIVYRVRVRILQLFVAADTAAETIDATQVALHICAPLLCRPRVALGLETCRRICGVDCGAIRFGRVYIITKCKGCDSHIVHLVKGVHPKSGPALLGRCAVVTHSYGR